MRGSTMQLLVDAETTVSIDVVAQDRSSMDRGISAAVEQLIEIALRLATDGIRITRLEGGISRIGLTNSVPFGYIEERDCRV